MKHIKTYEGFLKESKINEAQFNEEAENLADDWEATILTPADIKRMDKATDAFSKWASGAIKKLNAKQIYMISKIEIQDNDGLKDAGLKWSDFMKILKSGGVQYEEYKGDGDIVILFC